MTTYEIFMEDVNPCGGEKHRKTALIEAEAESPEAYVRENGRFPIMEITQTSPTETVITTGDGSGNFVRYTFSE